MKLSYCLAFLVVSFLTLSSSYTLAQGIETQGNMIPFTVKGKNVMTVTDDTLILKARLKIDPTSIVPPSTKDVCNAETDGSIIAGGSDKKIYICSGGEWINLATPSKDCGTGYNGIDFTSIAAPGVKPSASTVFHGQVVAETLIPNEMTGSVIAGAKGTCKVSQCQNGSYVHLFTIQAPCDSSITSTGKTTSDR